MGTGWSQDEDSQKSQGFRRLVSHNVTSLNHNAAGDRTEADAKATPNMKPPHELEAILKEADDPIDRSSMDFLYEQLFHGVFLNRKRMMYWVEKKSGSNCFMLFPRGLSITYGDDPRRWYWANLSEYGATSDGVNMEVAELLHVSWLEVYGKLEMKKLTRGVTYEVKFVITLLETAFGWDVPVNFRPILPNGTKQEHKEVLKTKPRAQWIEIPVAEFITSKENTGEIEISMYEIHGGDWKKGLVVKGIVVRPKGTNI